ncbi:sensor histidine kinase [Actinokineospora enzanensis]|uniref:sensor histidine kinase n=1 Tax=Actinokineospora enzanensis TaxID=155975 RepID=UPI00037E7E31|nr:sensor histidine kinase [Actinokineospora enzanensis]
MDKQRIPFTGRLTPRHLVVFDVAFAVAMAVLVSGNLAGGAWAPPGGVPDWIAHVVAALALVPVVLRRFWPVSVFAAAVVVAVLTYAVGVGWEGCLVLVFALYSLASSRGFRAGVFGMLIAMLLVVVAAVASDVAWVVLGCTLVVAGWALGVLSRERRELLALTARQSAAEAVGAERLRIARELHDVIAHDMTMITVRAAVANHVAADRPDEAGAALTEIEEASRAALAELRRMLGMLRATEDDAPVAPAPTLDQMTELIRRAELASVKVDVVYHDSGTMPNGVEQTVFRIVQEALTNVVRHAAPANCRVLVDDTGQSVTVEVTDDGTRLAADHPIDHPTGHGLIGMRERVGLYAGQFSAGPQSGGGFAVRAHLPYADTTEASTSRTSIGRARDGTDQGNTTTVAIREP